MTGTLFFRLLAGVCLTLCGAGTGLRAAAELSARARQLSLLVRMCGRLESLLLLRLPTGVITGLLIREGLLSDEGWERLTSAGTGQAEQAICARIAATLGHGDAQSQAAAVHLAGEELKALAMECRDAARSKGKLYSTLGLLLGMMGALMVV